MFVASRSKLDRSALQPSSCRHRLQDSASSLRQLGPRDEDLFIRPEDQHTVLFGSMDAGRSVFVSAGAKQSLTGPLDRNGVLMMETTGFGLTRERFRAGGGRSPRPPVHPPDERARRVPVELQDGLYLAAFAGPEVQQEQLTYGGRVYRFSQPPARRPRDSSTSGRIPRPTRW